MHIPSLLVILTASVAIAAPQNVKDSLASLEVENYLAPLEGLDLEEAFPDEFIVIFHNGHTLEEHYNMIGRNLSSEPRFERYGYGYSSVLDDDTRDNHVQRDPGVRMVETNRPVHLVAPTELANEGLPNYTLSSAKRQKRDYTEVVGESAPYGLQMVTTGASNSKLPTPVQDGGNYDFLYESGIGVQVYVMDTGIRITHELFEGRARNFGGLASTDKSPYCDEPMSDTSGHGTHVAGTIAALQYGVAQNESIINVKGEQSEPPPSFFAFRGSVINMSFEAQGYSNAILYNLIYANEAGISIFAAAGNYHRDASNTYPCAYVQTKCIAAVDSDYQFASSFSNYGNSVDFLAPGVGILSLSNASDTALYMLSGTSQASPHAAGAAAIFASWLGLTTNYDLSQNFVYWNSISGAISGVPGGTVNYLVTTGIHNPKKYPKEPFRWAGDSPVDNHANGPIIIGLSPFNPQSNYPTQDVATTIYTTMSTTTQTAVPGLTTEPGDLTYDPSVSTFPTAIPRRRR